MTNTITNIETIETKEMKLFHATGKLILKEVLDDCIFGIYNDKKVSYESLTEFLNQIYNSPSPFIRLYMRRISDGYTIVRNGELYKEKDSDGIYDWCVGNVEIGIEFELGKELYLWGEQDVDIYIEQIMEGKGHNGQTKFKAV